MSLDRTLAVALRVLRQVRNDHRSIALIFVVPPVLLALVQQMFRNQPGAFDHIGPLLLGLFPFTMMFLLTTIAVLRERTQGTLDRLMASPIGRGDLLVGYALAYTLVALAQAAVTVTVALVVLDLRNAGNLALTFGLVSAPALLGIALGLFLSAFARTELQAMQFLPAVVAPQLLIAGLFVPVDQLPGWLEAAARAMPLAYAFELLRRVMIAGAGLDDAIVGRDLAIIAGVAALFLVAGSLTLRRSEP